MNILIKNINLVPMDGKEEVIKKTLIFALKMIE